MGRLGLGFILNVRGPVVEGHETRGTLIEEEMNFRDWRKLAVFVSGEFNVSFLARPGYSVELGSTHPCHSVWAWA